MSARRGPAAGWRRVHPGDVRAGDVLAVGVSPSAPHGERVTAAHDAAPVYGGRFVSVTMTDGRVLSAPAWAWVDVLALPALPGMGGVA